jgi:hypothetical protein
MPLATLKLKQEGFEMSSNRTPQYFRVFYPDLHTPKKAIFLPHTEFYLVMPVLLETTSISRNVQ